MVRVSNVVVDAVGQTSDVFCAVAKVTVAPIMPFQDVHLPPYLSCKRFPILLFLFQIPDAFTRQQGRLQNENVGLRGKADLIDETLRELLILCVRRC